MHKHTNKSFDVSEKNQLHTIYWDNTRNCWRRMTTKHNGVSVGDINEHIAKFYFLMALSHIDKSIAQTRCEQFFGNNGKLL